jgi:acetyl esterase/lipase
MQKFEWLFIMEKTAKYRLFLALVLAMAQAVSGQTNLEKTTTAYKKIDGHEILADVYRPKGDRICPVIVHLHGGALIMGNRALESPSLNAYRAQHPERPYFDLLEFAARHGYAVVSIDYRLAPETKLPEIISDVESAFRWIGGEGARQFYLDTDRMLTFGGSAGGYLTLVTGYRVSPKPKALVSLYGYGQLNAGWYTKPNPYPGYTRREVTREEAMRQTDGRVISDGELRTGNGSLIYMYYRQNGLWTREVSGFSQDSLAREIVQYEPAKNVTREYPPTLLIHGTQDTDVPFEESVNMAEQFKKNGVPYIFLPIQKGEHEFIGGDLTQIKDAYHTMMEFMTKYLETK